MLSLLEGPMQKRTPILAALLALATTAGAWAQETAPATPPEDGAAAPAVPAVDELPLGRPADEAPDGPGSTYVAGTFGDWEQRCVRTEDGADPCQLYQLLMDGQGNPVAEFNIFGLPAGQQAVAGATAVVPLETLLTQELTLQIDATPARKYPFTFCAPIGCISRVGFTQADVDAMKKGNKISVTIVPVVAPESKVTVELSLKGFTAGYDAVNAANQN